MTYKNIAIIVIIFSVYFIVLPYYLINKYGKNYNGLRQQYGAKFIENDISYHWTKYNIKVRFEIEKRDNFLVEKELGFQRFKLYTEADCYTINLDTVKYEITKGFIFDKILTGKDFFKSNSYYKKFMNGDKEEFSISEIEVDSIINYYKSSRNRLK
jgi:hypothetical protein